MSNILSEMYTELFQLEILAADKSRSKEEREYLQKSWKNLKGEIFYYNLRTKGNPEFGPNTVEGIQLCLRYGKNDFSLALREAQQEEANRIANLSVEERNAEKKAYILNQMETYLKQKEIREQDAREFSKYRTE